jgi:carbonic anhydrase/acetyltransferase-like protein (isoleucine patch superfamily)
MDKKPVIHPKAVVDVSARIIGDVHVKEGASIWPMAVLRADSAEIRIGRRASILDLAMLEAPEGHPVWVADEALVSHGAMLHGASVESRALVGMGAIVLDGAFVSGGSIIGAGSLLPPGTRVPPNSLVLGVPGKVVRETTQQERESIMVQLAELHDKARHL